MVYEWPGNVRELENALEHAVVLSRGNLIEAASLPERITKRRKEPLVAERSYRNPTLEVIERAYIMWVLQAEGGNKTRAAEVLGIDPSTLYRKLSRYEEQVEVKALEPRDPERSETRSRTWPRRDGGPAPHRSRCELAPHFPSVPAQLSVRPPRTANLRIRTDAQRFARRSDARSALLQNPVPGRPGADLPQGLSFACLTILPWQWVERWTRGVACALPYPAPVRPPSP